MDEDYGKGLLDVGFERGPSGFVEIAARCSRAFVCEAPLLFVGEFSYAELAAAAEGRLAGLGEGGQARRALPADFLADHRNCLFLASGWQSWSFAGELAWRERPRRAFLLRGLNRFVDHPAEAELRGLARRLGGRPDIVSHFFAVLRDGEARLGIVSSGPAGEKGRQAPPLSFLLGKRSLRIYAYAEGGSFAAGETAARAALVPAAGWFELKDGFAEIAAGGAGRSRSLALIAGEAPARPRAGGFETWYNRYLHIDEGSVLADLEALASSPDIVVEALAARGRPPVFQIDDGWERRVGDWSPDEIKFPRGMAPLAAAAAAKGFVPGLWLAPFLVMPGSRLALDHPAWLLSDEGGRPVSAGWNPGWGGEVQCLDLSLPEVEDYLVELLRTVVQDWGFGFLKLDFLYAGMLRGRRRGRAGGAWEHYARVLSRIAAIGTGPDGKGPPVPILACGAPFETTAPIAPLLRTGADTRESWDWPLLRLVGHQGRPAAKVNLSHSLARALLDRSFLLSDPDVIFLRTKRIGLSDSQKFLVGVAAWIFGSQLMTSDPPEPPGASGPDGGRGLSQADFSAELAALWKGLGERDFAVERFGLESPELHRFWSRDGEIYGAINLSGRTEALSLESPAGETKPAILPPGSLVLFGLGR